MHPGIEHYDGSHTVASLTRRFIPNHSDISRLLVQAQAALACNPAAAMDCIAQASALLGSPNAGPEAGVGETAAPRGGLAPWQITRVRTHIRNHVGSPILLQDLANLTRLSASHFARAFKISFGEPPHAYIVRQRIEHARHLMLTTSEPLASIALDCGLADQSHLTRLFRKHVGTSPQAWRREHRAGPLLHV